MKLIFPPLSEPIVIDSESVVSLVIENQSFMYSFVRELSDEVNKNTGNIVLSSGNSVLDISKKIELITQFVPFEINKKSLITKLHNKLKNVASEELYIESNEIVSLVQRYLISLCDKLHYDIVVDDFGEVDLMKIAGVRFESQYDTLSEMVFEYCNLTLEFEGEKLFVLVNMKSFISEEEYYKLCKTIVGHKLCVLFVDNVIQYQNQLESIHIIDNDLCVI